MSIVFYFILSSFFILLFNLCLYSFCFCSVLNHFEMYNIALCLLCKETEKKKNIKTFNVDSVT